MANTATWDESNPEDIICVVGVDGVSQAIHGRSVAETLGRIPKTMVSEFGMSQPEADAFTEMALEKRTERQAEADDMKAQLTKAERVLRRMSGENQDLKRKIAQAEKERDDALAEKAILSTSLTQATAKIAHLLKPAVPPTPPSEPEASSGKAKKK